MSRWKDIRNSNFDVNKQCITIDGWTTKGNMDDEGRVLAEVYLDKVEYKLPSAKIDPNVKKVIQEAILKLPQYLGMESE
jgi:hypothetical protein